MNVTYESLSEPVSVRSTGGMGADRHKWARDGVLILPGAIPHDVIESYRVLRDKVQDKGGWSIETPYVHYREIRDLCLMPRVLHTMQELIGEPVALHLNLTGFVSTERNWHSDSYLNPEGVDDHYIAAWYALDDIHPDSGPFQYVAGSHRWPVIRRKRIFERLSHEEQRDPAWPSFTEPWVAKACEEEMKARGTEVTTYLPKRGDVLLWHAFLVHRGSPPNVPGMLRPACIAHYSGVNHRPDMGFFRVNEHARTLERKSLLEDREGKWLGMFDQKLRPTDPPPTGSLLNFSVS